MFKLTIMSAFLAAVLGLGSAYANAQTVSKDEVDMTTGNAPGAAQQGGDDKNELKDPGAAAGQHEGGRAPHNENGQAKQGRAEEHGEHAGGQQSGQAQQQPAGGSPQQDETTGQGQGVKDSGGTAGVKTPEGSNTPEDQGAAPAQNQDSSTGTASSQQEETTGQGQGVKDSGGTAGVKTPEESSNTPADHDQSSVISRENDESGNNNP